MRPSRRSRTKYPLATIAAYGPDNARARPTAGDLIPGTGGVRKLRWVLEGRGKRGGARIIHFFHNTRLPLFLLTAFAKNERTDLSQADRNGLRTVTKLLVDTYGRRGS